MLSEDVLNEIRLAFRKQRAIDILRKFQKDPEFVKLVSGVHVNCMSELYDFLVENGYDS